MMLVHIQADLEAEGCLAWERVEEESSHLTVFRVPQFGWVPLVVCGRAHG
jgi:hypothetical protein